jgi:hypothetical protein
MVNPHLIAKHIAILRKIYRHSLPIKEINVLPLLQGHLTLVPVSDLARAWWRSTHLIDPLSSSNLHTYIDGPSQYQMQNVNLVKSCTSCWLLQGKWA